MIWNVHACEGESPAVASGRTPWVERDGRRYVVLRVGLLDQQSEDWRWAPPKAKYNLVYR